MFLVNNQNVKDGLDYATLKNAFRSLDDTATGTLRLEQIKASFKDTLSEKEIEALFQEIDLDHNGEVNYTEFLTVTAEKSWILTLQNLRFAFHHFDVNRSGHITGDNLKECFKREGKHLTDEEI